MIIMVISGLNIMNSMIFSIRERIPEIGIRKTVGADNVDIVRQMIIEGCITVLIGAFIALILTVLGLTFAKLYLNSLPIAEFRVHFSLRIVEDVLFCTAPRDFRQCDSSSLRVQNPDSRRDKVRLK